jgi:hypothetical protein
MECRNYQMEIGQSKLVSTDLSKRELWRNYSGLPIVLELLKF